MGCATWRSCYGPRRRLAPTSLDYLDGATPAARVWPRAGSLESGIAAWAPLPVLDAASAPASGFGTQRTLYPARQRILPAGPVEGVTYAGDGSVIGRIALELDAPRVVLPYAIALVNGVEHVLIADGDLAGTWVPSVRVTMREA